MLKTKSIRFSYNDSTKFDFPDIHLEKGEKLLVLGESGIGKTTLLHIIGGLLKPSDGSVELNGTLLTELSTNKLDDFRGHNVGIVFQKPHFIQALSLRENLALIQYLAGKKMDYDHIKTVLSSLGIEHKIHSKPKHLSQGEQQRASIALAVVNSPELILADEPTSSLDDLNTIKVTDLLKQQADIHGSQLIIITHDKRLKDQFENTLQL